jgi:hypothetical protein
LHNLDPNSFFSALICPFPDDSAFPRPSIRTMNVHGYDASDTHAVAVSACVTYWGVNGAACGTPGTGSSGTGWVGDFTIKPALNVWQTNWADFPYFYVFLPPAVNGTARAYFRGVWVSDS